MNVLYLLIVWLVCLSYIGFNLYCKDFWGRVIAGMIFFAAVTYTIYFLSLLGGIG
ncbi:hypothetical protein [Enterococcus sp. AZ196]|uniref:hypothetical protein n=1 Tax=Enterococcus sp. AZ196 TaxID=2774659 RepID=UPI003D269E8F